MYVKSRQFIARHQHKLLLLIIWLHITFLDLFVITGSGAKLLWHDNLQIKTILTHVTIALTSFSFYLLVHKLRRQYHSKRFIVGDNIWLLCSVFLAISIGFMLL